MKRRALVVAPLVLLGALLSVASSLGAFDPPAVRTGRGVLVACDADGLRTASSWDWDATHGRYEITAVSITGVSRACAGQLAKVVITNSSGLEVGGGAAVISPDADGSVDVSLKPAPSVQSAVSVHVIIGSSP